MRNGTKEMLNIISSPAQNEVLCLSQINVLFFLHLGELVFLRLFLLASLSFVAAGYRRKQKQSIIFAVIKKKVRH